MATGFSFLIIILGKITERRTNINANKEQQQICIFPNSRINPSPQKLSPDNTHINKAVNKVFYTSWRNNPWWELFFGIGLFY